jgi:hypothetical protein
VRHRQIHPIDDYLSEDWIDEWAREVVSEVEIYLAKHAELDAFTDEQPT